MSTSKRVGPAARKNRGDTRERPRHESAPQRRVRVDLGRFDTYEAAAEHADLAYIHGDIPHELIQIRKRANGFHVYRRETIK